MSTFDTAKEALDYMDKLPDKQRKSARLSNILIEGIYDKRGTLQEGLYEWRVKLSS